MPENSKRFHEFALQSSLFKGRSDWYFCYLKSEKIGHVLYLLAAETPALDGMGARELGQRTLDLAGEVAHLSAGEMELPAVLADVFGLMSALRGLGVRGVLRPEHVNLLLKEYEQLAERLVRGSNPSPFIASEELRVVLPQESVSLLEGSSMRADASIKDTSKGQIYKGHVKESKGQSSRMTLILDLVRKKKSLSIKEIASVIKDCSEKTIQRELNILIERGLIRREGERRWSVYVPA